MIGSTKYELCQLYMKISEDKTVLWKNHHIETKQYMEQIECKIFIQMDKEDNSTLNLFKFLHVKHSPKMLWSC